MCADIQAKVAIAGEHTLPFTKGEYAICAHLALHSGQVFTKEQLYEAVFGFEAEGDASAVAEHIKNIRAKLKADAISPIETVWRVGYKWQKKQRSVSLSFVLLRFAIVMLGGMLLYYLVWYCCFGWLQNTGVIYQGYVSNQQVEQMLAGEPKTFVPPDDDFLAEYALFGQNGDMLESNVASKKLEVLAGFLPADTDSIHVSRHTYTDGSTVIFHWYYRAEFTNPVLLDILPPFEYLWLATLGGAWVLCLLFNTLWLRRRLATKLKLFGEVSEKVGAQELDFAIPHAGIREYDQALGAMEHMKEALYRSLSS